MFLNRWMYRHEIVELNKLTAAEELEVFAFLKPLQGTAEHARYLEKDADEAVGRVRRGGKEWERPQVPAGGYVAGREGGMARKQVNSWADSVKKEKPEAVSPAPRLLMDEKESARMLGVSRRTIFDLNKRGVLPSVRIGRRKLYQVSVIEALARGEVA